MCLLGAVDSFGRRLQPGAEELPDATWRRLDWAGARQGIEQQEGGGPLNFKKLWIGFIAVIVLSFSTIGYFGLEIFREAPPVPAEVVDAGGRTLFTGQDIRDGQNVWQSMGGQELGTIWGHGSYVAPDWSADWLHREATFILDRWAEQDFGQRYSQLVPENQALLRTRLQEEIRRNTYDYSTGSPPPGWRRAFSSLRPCRASSLAFRDSA